MKRSESTNDKIVRLYNEGWTAERIAEEITISTGAVNSILERRIPGYAEYLAKKSLETNKAKTAAKEKAAEEAAEEAAAKATEETEAKTIKETPVKAAVPAAPAKDDGMLVEDYKQQQTEPKKENVNILTSPGNTNLLTGDMPKNDGAKETVPRTTAARRTVKKDAPAETPAEAKTTSTRTTRTSKTTDKEESAVDTPAKTAASPVTRANQKIKAFATSEIEENNAKIQEIEAQLAVLSKQATELRSQIAALKIENEQFQSIIK